MANRIIYEQFIMNAFQREEKRFEEERETSLTQVSTSVPLFGYSPSRWMLDFSAMSAFLYARSGIEMYADRAKDGLMFYHDWLDYLPPDAPSQRPEYTNSIPPMEPVFCPIIYTPVIKIIRNTLTTDEMEIFVKILADSLKPIWRFPEWGGHNRAMLRAAGLALAAEAFPDHTDSGQWTSLANELAEESWGRWSIEDAMLYQPHWLRALIIYATARSRVKELVDFIQPKMYLKAITQLISPLDILPDYGDSHWLMHSHWEWMACLEWGASVYQDPHMKWAAARLFEGRKSDTPSAYLATVAGLAWQWCDENVKPEPPINRDDALDDLVLKKVVWRTGWNKDATYACLNYRDEGDYGRIARDYLRSTLAVSAEKMHHGHADEGSFSMLVHKGTLLLHESGYREQPPDGIYRSGIYHNRLVWQSGYKSEDTDLLEFYRRDGRYRPVRTERLYQTRLGDSSYQRIRITDDVEGLVWDRSIVFLPEFPCWIVIDGISATRTDFRTISSIWWTTDILAQGNNWYTTYIRGVQDWKNKKTSALFICSPSVPEQSGNLSVIPYRRHFQNEKAILNTWRGQLNTNKFINFISILWPIPFTKSAERHQEAFKIIESQPSGRGIGIQMNWNDEERLIGVLNDLTYGSGVEDIRPTYTSNRGMVQYNTINSDAALVMARRNSKGIWSGLINGTYLSYNDQVRYQGLPHAMFQENKTTLPGVPARFRWESGWNPIE